MTQPRTGKLDPLKHDEETAERAARIAAMLGRWDSENVADEPDWDTRDVPRLELRTPP